MYEPSSPIDVDSLSNHSDLPREAPTDRTQLAGDVVPLPARPTNMDQMIKTGGNKDAIYAKDSDKVTSYGSFLSKKFPLKDK